MITPDTEKKSLKTKGGTLQFHGYNRSIKNLKDIKSSPDGPVTQIRGTPASDSTEEKC